MFKQSIQSTSKRLFATKLNPFPPLDLSKLKVLKEHYNHLISHSEVTMNLWKKISIFLAFPSIAITGYFIYNIEMSHAHHREHLLKVSDEDWPVAYDYQNIRKKPFFWGDGDKTLFWNPVINRHITE